MGGFSHGWARLQGSACILVLTLSLLFHSAEGGGTSQFLGMGQEADQIVPALSNTQRASEGNGTFRL